MIIYILMLAISIFFAFLSKKVKNRKLHILIAIMAALPFAIVSSIRYDVGTDYLYRYVNDYNVLLKGGDVTNLEIGFKLLDKFCILITDNYQLVFALTSLIITAFIFYTIYRDSKNVMLSIALYFIGAFFFQSLNMTRQYIAISMIFYSYKYFLKGNWIKWGVFSILASMFHTTSLIATFIFIISYLLKKIIKKDIFANEKIVLVLIAILFFGEPLIRNLINFLLVQTRFKVYVGSNYDYGDLQIIPFIINLLLYIGMIYIVKKKNEEINDTDRFFITVQAIALIFVTLGKTSFLSIRLVYYFSIFQIISIPYFLKYVKNIFEKKTYIISTIIVVMIFSATVVWTHVLHTSDEILPYKTIFNKKYEFK